MSGLNYCNNCENEAVGFYKTDNGAEFHLCQSCREAFELGQVNPDNAFTAFEEDEDKLTYRCDNCDFTTTNEETFPTLGQVHKLGERLDPGSIVPDGECPKCGAFVYRDTKKSEGTCT